MSEESDRDWKQDLEAELETELGLEEFRDRCVMLIASDDSDGLRALCDRQVTLPLYVEKLIDEIGPENDWNDLLCLMARKLIEASPDLRGFLSFLEEKRHLIARPNAGKEIIGVVTEGDVVTGYYLKSAEET